jgi:hypothetical protein
MGDMGLFANCAGVSRRDFIQIGLGGTVGLGFCDLLRLRAAEPARQLAGKNVNCILVWMDGGPSHYETFDPKPDAPSEIRGDFKPISTSVPGIQFSEAVPHLAQAADKLTIVRSVCHKDPNHGGGNHYMMTGAPTPVPVACGAFVTFHPSFGSMVSYDRGIRKGLVPYVSIPEVSRSGGPNFLGAQHAPFVIDGSPNSDSFKVRDVTLPAEISEGRAASRQELRHALDSMQRFADKLADDPAVAFDEFYARGMDLVGSAEAQKAFDIHSEDKKVRESYGRNDFGQRLLLARRLVEVGVSFVTVYTGGWDHHTKIFDAYKGDHLKRFDQGVAALINDLDSRGLLENTLVIALGEFGRTPKVNKDAGRDHWPRVSCAALAGGGFRHGQVIGATDRLGGEAVERAVDFQEIFATLYHHLGIDTRTATVPDLSGRPRYLVDEQFRPLPELV